MALHPNTRTFWSARTDINRAIYNIKMLMGSNIVDTVSKQSLLLEYNTLKNIQLRLSKLEKWMYMVDSEEETN